MNMNMIWFAILGLVLIAIIIYSMSNKSIKIAGLSCNSCGSKEGFKDDYSNMNNQMMTYTTEMP